MAGVTRLRRQHLRYLAQAAPRKMAWRHHCAGFRQTSNRERDGRTPRVVGPALLTYVLRADSQPFCALRRSDPAAGRYMAASLAATIIGSGWPPSGAEAS